MGRLRYGAAALNFTAAVSTAASYVFTANGLYDPNITGGSLSPAGFSLLMTTYEHYIVFRSKIVVIFTNNSTTPTMVGIALEPDVTFSTDPSNVLELPFEQLVQLEPAGVYGSSKTLSMTANLSKYFGENVLKTTSLYRGDVASNPTEQAYYHCKAFGLKGSSADVFMTVKIEYEAMFTEPRELSPSLQDAIQGLVLTQMREQKQDQEAVLVTKTVPLPSSGTKRA